MNRVDACLEVLEGSQEPPSAEQIPAKLDARGGIGEAAGMARILLVTGVSGVGKTTLMVRLLAALRNRRVGGFTTQDIREGGRRVGFRIIPHRGTERIMAHVARCGSPRVGRYGIDVNAIDEVARQSLALDPAIDVYLLDEIGKMECYSQEFCRNMSELLDSNKTVVATISRHGGGFIAAVRGRPDAELWEVTPANRDPLLERLLAWLGNPTSKAADPLLSAEPHR
jgi:nucleoside-triphosphatase